MRPMRMVKLTPILLVDAIEPCLKFWERLGFQRTIEVPEGERLGFAAVQKGAVEIMYQTRESMRKDLPALAGGATPASTILYCEVENLEEYEKLLESGDIVVPLRETSYGSAEIFVREPAGNVVAFTAKAGY